MTEHPIPDAPELPPWVIAWAEYGEECVGILDVEIAKRFCACPRNASATKGRFRVGATPVSLFPSRHERGCSFDKQNGLDLHLVKATDSEAEALAVFAAHRDALAGEGQDNVPV